MREEVAFSKIGEDLRAELCCEIDHHSARRIRERIDGELFRLKPCTLILDFAGVRFMDSSGIALILGRVEVMSSLDGRVRLTRVAPSIMKLLRLSGLERIPNLAIDSQ